MNQLKKISTAPDRHYNKFNLIYNDKCEEAKLLDKLLNYLQLAKVTINTSKETNNDSKQVIICCKPDELPFDNTNKDQVMIFFCAAPTDRITNSIYVDFSEKHQFYQSTFKLLEMLTQSKSIKTAMIFLEIVKAYGILFKKIYIPTLKLP